VVDRDVDLLLAMQPVDDRPSPMHGPVADGNDFGPERRPHLLHYLGDDHSSV
jgi:hypothetical protein